MRNNRIKYNHIRHTKEALEDVFTELSLAIDDLVAFGLPLADNNNHQMYDKNGDLWHDKVEDLMNSLFKLIPDKEGEAND